MMMLIGGYLIWCAIFACMFTEILSQSDLGRKFFGSGDPGWARCFIIIFLFWPLIIVAVIFNLIITAFKRS